MAVGIELQRLELNIPELKTVVNKVQDRRLVRGVIDRPAELYLDGTPELIGRELFVKVYQEIALNPL